MEEVAAHIKENGGYIEDAGEGREWRKFRTGKEITKSGLRFIVSFNGMAVARKTEEIAFVALHRKGKLDLFQLGFNTCPKCDGSGQVPSRIDNGVCFKCRGYGIMKS